MPNFTKLELRMLGRHSIEVSWAFSSEDDVSNYLFMVERSEHPRDPDGWLDVSGWVTGQDAFVDSTVNRSDKWQMYYYRVNYKHITDSTNTGLSCTDITPEQASLSLQKTYTRCNTDKRFCSPVFDIIRRGHVLLDNPRYGVGRDCLIYTRISDYAVENMCPHCMDITSRRQIKEQCSFCNNTGFSRGYYKPIRVNVSFSPRNEADRLQPQEKVQTQNTSLWMMNFPLVNPEDVIYDISFADLYRIQSVKKNWNSLVTYQDIMAVHMGHGHILGKKAEDDLARGYFVDGLTVNGSIPPNKGIEAGPARPCGE